MDRIETAVVKSEMSLASTALTTLTNTVTEIDKVSVDFSNAWDSEEARNTKGYVDSMKADLELLKTSMANVLTRIDTLAKNVDTANTQTISGSGQE